MRFGNREFRPRLWPTVATIILLPVLLRLGFWQLERAEEKRRIQQQFELQQTKPAIKLGRLDQQADIEYRRVTVRGHLDSRHQILLDNQVHEKRVGYHVLTPLHIAEGDKTGYVLVNRGWVPGNLRRDKLPEIDIPEQLVNLQGRLKKPGGIGLKLAERSYFESKWPLVVQWVDIAEIRKLLDEDIYPYILRLDADQPYGFVREWKIINTQPEKSTSYAVQWFSLAAALVLIFIVVNTRKTENAKRKY